MSFKIRHSNQRSDANLQSSPAGEPALPPNCPCLRTGCRLSRVSLRTTLLPTSKARLCPCPKRGEFPPYAPLCCIGGEERRSSGAVASHRSNSRRLLETRLQVCPHEVERRGGGRCRLH